MMFLIKERVEDLRSNDDGYGGSERGRRRVRA